jgi:sirohydrochlorin cobaltochelatase
MLHVIKTRIEETESAFGAGYDRKATLLLMVGRGTSDSDVNSNISKMTRLIWESMGFAWAETCYCAVTKPLLPEALEQTHQLGYRQVIVFPYMLFMGRLVQYIHGAVDAYRAQHPNSKALVAPYLNAHPLIVETLLERLHQTEAGDNQMNCHLCQYKELIVGYEHRHGQPQTSHHHHHHHHHHHGHSQI